MLYLLNNINIKCGSDLRSLSVVVPLVQYGFVAGSWITFSCDFLENSSAFHLRNFWKNKLIIYRDFFNALHSDMAKGCSVSPLTKNHIGIKFPTMSLGDERRRIDAKTACMHPNKYSSMSICGYILSVRVFFSVDPISNVRQWRIFGWDHDVTVWVWVRVCMCLPNRIRWGRKKRIELLSFAFQRMQKKY